MDMSTIDDSARLMMRVKDGHMESFDELITTFRASVVNTLYRITGSSSDAEDLAQQVFVKVYRARKRYEPRAKFSTWLFRIVRNVAYNYLRDRKKEQMVSIHTGTEEDDWELSANQPSPMQLAGASDLQTAIDAAIRALPPNQRTAVVLARFEGKAYAEIATILETTEAAVKMLVKRARANLAKSLAPHL